MKIKILKAVTWSLIHRALKPVISSVIMTLSLCILSYGFQFSTISFSLRVILFISLCLIITLLFIRLKKRVSADHKRRDYEALISDEIPNVAHLRIRLFPELIIVTWSVHTLIEVCFASMGKHNTGDVFLYGLQGILDLFNLPIFTDLWANLIVPESTGHRTLTSLIQFAVGLEIFSEFSVRSQLFEELFACPDGHLRELQSTRFDQTPRGTILSERLTRGLEVNHKVALKLIDSLVKNADFEGVHRAIMGYRAITCVPFESLKVCQTRKLSSKDELALLKQHQDLLRGFRQHMEEMLPQSKREIAQCGTPFLADLLSAIKLLASIDIQVEEQSPKLSPKESIFTELYLEELITRSDDEGMILLEELAELCDQHLLFENELYSVLKRFNNAPPSSKTTQQCLDRVLEVFGRILDNPKSKIQAMALDKAHRYAARQQGWTKHGPKSWKRPLPGTSEKQEVTFLPLKVSWRGDESMPRGNETRLMLTGPLLLDVSPISEKSFRKWRETEGSVISLKDGFFPIQSPVPENHPQSPFATYVSWYAAYIYCRSMGGRMISEAEWERAARGGLEGVSPHLSEEAGESGLCLGVVKSGLEWTGDQYRSDAYETAGFIRPLIQGDDIKLKRVNRVYRGGLSVSHNRERVARMSGDPIGAAIDQPLTFRVAFDIREEE